MLNWSYLVYKGIIKVVINLNSSYEDEGTYFGSYIMSILLFPSDLTTKTVQDKHNVTGDKWYFSLHQTHTKVISKSKPSFLDSFGVVWR